VKASGLNMLKTRSKEGDHALNAILNLGYFFFL
jgi:hypothetical protein